MGNKSSGPSASKPQSRLFSVRSNDSYILEDDASSSNTAVTRSKSMYGNMKVSRSNYSVTSGSTEPPLSPTSEESLCIPSIAGSSSARDIATEGRRFRSNSHYTLSAPSTARGPLKRQGSEKRHGEDCSSSGRFSSRQKINEEQGPSSSSVVSNGSVDKKHPLRGTLSSDSTSALSLTAVQRQMVVKLWNQVRHRGTHEPGITIFHYACIKGSYLRPIFCCKQENGVIVKDETENIFAQHIKTHALSFIEILDKVLHCPDKNNEIVAELQDMGARHAILREAGFKTQYWEVFASAMIDCTLEWGDRAKRNPEIQKAWTEIVMFLVREMKSGYYAEVRRRRKVGGSGSFRNSSSNEQHKPSSSSGSKTSTSSLPNPDELQVPMDTLEVTNETFGGHAPVQSTHSDTGIEYDKS